MSESLQNITIVEEELEQIAIMHIESIKKNWDLR